MSNTPPASGAVWTYVEHRGGKASRVAWELLTPGRQLADTLGVPLGVVIIGDSGSRLAMEAFAYGADVAYCVDDLVYAPYRTETHLHALRYLVETYHPQLLLLGATESGRELAASLAVDLQSGLAAECLAFAIDDPSRRCLMTRTAFDGKLLTTIVCERSPLQMATVLPRVMPAPPRQPGRNGQIIRETLPLSEALVATKIVKSYPWEQPAVDLAHAEVIVTVGRGLGGPEYLHLAQGLAEALGGVLGATRGVVDLGWLSPAHLIGQSGQTVHPKLYVAIGVSGAPQHLAGISRAGTLIAIDENADAPIFRVATLGLVGDLFAIVPALTARIRAAQGRVSVPV